MCLNSFAFCSGGHSYTLCTGGHFEPSPTLTLRGRLERASHIERTHLDLRVHISRLVEEVQKRLQAVDLECR